MPKVVALASQKGGVGKTTCAMTFAAVAAEHRNVLLVDVDEQASAQWWSSRVAELPFDIAADTNQGLLAKLKQQPYDIVVVDCPGHLDGAGVIPAVLRAVDLVVLVTEPTALAFPPLRRSIDAVIRPAGVRYRVLLNKVDMGKGGAGKEADARKSLEGAGIPVFKTAIRAYNVHELAPLYGEVATGYQRTKGNLNAIEDARKFTTELIGEWSFTNPPAEIRLTDSRLKTGVR